MRYALHLPNYTYPAPHALGTTLRDIVQTADQGGFHSLSVMDHFFQIEYVGPADMEMLSSYTTLGYIAAHTSRVKLGTLVTGVVYRHPGLLAKAVTTLDVLSGGRAYLGIGAAWFEREARGLGAPFPPLKERFEQLEETLQVCRQMWSADNGPYQGRHYQLAETLCVPQPISRPHPPILVGGGGERRTLRLVAQYADACNLFEFLGPDTLRQKLDTLKRHCDDVGRDYDSIEKTLLGRVTPDASAAEILERSQVAAHMGFQRFYFTLGDVFDRKLLDLMVDEVIPRMGTA
ncbi:MAG TPA: LLM class F420-dependent oxidoreductase [bacterium]|nr:LLM class F420-dependent oxidoreductase [bacterium]